MSRASVTTALTLAALLAMVVGLQAVQDRRTPLGLPTSTTGNLLYLRSPTVVRKASLSYAAITADVYWIRTLQHYGRTKLATSGPKQYDLLYPLLDLTTALDPHFERAYRLGAVLLSEPYPAGPGRSDQAIELLMKGLAAEPDSWQLMEDVGFVHYWFRQDYRTAAEWFDRASDAPHAPNWLRPLAAVTLAQGGSVQSSRTLWQRVLESADVEWLRVQARFRLKQLDAMDTLHLLELTAREYQRRTGFHARSWQDLVTAGLLRGIPMDAEGHAFQLNPFSGAVTLDRQSPLNPLPLTGYQLQTP
jgi:hypothetical protein